MGYPKSMKSLSGSKLLSEVLNFVECFPVKPIATIVTSTFRRAQEARRPKTGAICCFGCTSVGLRKKALKSRWSKCPKGKSQASRVRPSTSKVNTPMVGFGQRQVYTGWFAKAHLILEPGDTPHFHPCLSRQRSMTMSTLKSIRPIFASIPIGHRERVASPVTDLTLRLE